MRRLPTRVAVQPLFAALLLACVLATVAAAQTTKTLPAWASQPQVFMSGSGYYFQHDGDVDYVPTTGQGWGWYVPDTDSDASLRREITQWKNPGKLYFMHTNLANLYMSPPPEWDSFRMRNLDGGYLNQYGGANAPRYSLTSTVFQEAIQAAAKRAVDLGADGIIVDDVQGQLSSLVYNLPHAGGTFDPTTMAAFRNYLQQKYSGAELQAKFGISDISTFDLGNYIRAKGIADTWNQFPMTGAPLEFFRFKQQESVAFLRSLAQSTKQYAKQQYGREFTMTCNPNDDALAFFVADAMDMTTAELFPIRGMDHPFMALDVKAWKGRVGVSAVIPEAMPPGIGNNPMPLDKPTVNLERVIFADIAAAGGIPLFSMQMNNGVQGAEPIDLNVVRRYANFITGNPLLMSQLTVQPQAALLDAAASRMGGRITAQSERDPWLGDSNYLGTARLLLDSGISYDSVFLPDRTYSTLSSPSAAALAKYRVVIAPSVWALDDDQLATLLAYAQQGGTLIIDGHFASSQADGSTATRPDVQTLIATTGAKPYGAGTVVVTQAVFGVQYQTSDATGQRTTRGAFQAFMAPYASADAVITQPQAVIHEPGVTPFFYRDRNGRPLVHLVNYDYDDATDQFITKSNLQVKVQVAASDAVDEVILRSPDMTGAQSLPFTRAGNAITLTVPSLEAWAVLYFQKNANAPVLVSAGTPTRGAAGCSTVPLSVTATDADGNPLTYVWSVNGQVVADAFGPNYTLTVPCDSSGLINVTVVVTDGTRTNQYQWTINTAPYKKPRVLFDDTHDERDTIDAATASKLNPDHPDWVLFGGLAAELQSNYAVSHLASGEITSNALAATDVLVLAAPMRNPSTAENTAITSFVKNGGGMVFIGDTGNTLGYNSLLGQWGIQWDWPRVASPIDASDYHANFPVSTWASDPAVGPNPGYFVAWGGTLTATSPARTIGMTDAAAWKSTSGMSEKQPGEPSGPFPIVAAADAGRGHVFAIADNSFTDAFAWTGNDKLLLSALSWMTANVNAPPPALFRAESGWWWDPKLGGMGFFIENGGKSGSGMFAGGFLYDAAGNATWLVSTGSVSGSMYEGVWWKVTGGQTLLGSYKAPSQTPAGNLSMTFTDSTHAVMTRPDGTQINLQRFSFTGTPPAAPIAGTPQSGWWWAGSNLGGTGYGIEIQGSSAFIVAYMYDDAGNPVWYLATGSLTTPTSYAGTWDLYAGGPQLTSPEGSYGTHKVSTASPMTLTFTDATHGTLTMGSASIPIVRFQEF